MARKPRNMLFSEAQVFHVFQRGNNKQPIFKDDADYRRFLDLIERYKKRYNFDLYHYNLIQNHIHMEARFKSQQILSKTMQGILQVFQLHHRKKYSYVGRLYQNRFKSVPIENDAQLLDCARYIERNSLKHKLAKSLENHKWSSFHYYAKGKNDPLITPNPMFLELAKKPNRRRKLYLQYLLEERNYED